MYNILQGIPTEDPPVFVAINLNNIPCVDLKNVDGATLVCEHSRLKQKLSEVYEEQAAMKDQLAPILERYLNQQPLYSESEFTFQLLYIRQ